MNRRLYRCHHDKSLAGVASGIAEYFDLDPTVVRVLWIVAALLSGGLAILLYVILAFVMPVEPYGPPAARTAPAGQGWATVPGAPGAGAATPTVDPVTGEPVDPTATGFAGAAGEAGAGTGFADPTTDPTAGAAGSTDWTTTGSTGWYGPPAYATHPAGHAHAPRPRGEGRFGLAFGIVLVMFGTIALLGPVFPGWFAGVALGPAFLVALGIALVAVSVRRPSPES